MYDSRIADSAIDNFFEALSVLETKEEYYRFFEDICTVVELKSIAQRLEVAQMLSEDKIYADIAKETGASTATISRVKKCLNYGADGYKLVIERLNEKNK